MQQCVFSTSGLDVMEAAVEDLWVEHSDNDSAHSAVKGVCLGMAGVYWYSLAIIV